ncbi:MAG: hypothetical protein WCS84_13925 [Nocardioides sp.]|jgi:hypothetical protein
MSELLTLALAAPVVALMVLTALGEGRRGARALTAVVAGVFFPVTWTVWYVRDERPYVGRHPRRRT